MYLTDSLRNSVYAKTSLIKGNIDQARAIIQNPVDLQPEDFERFNSEIDDIIKSIEEVRMNVLTGEL